jgi:hypothetical protein
MVGCTAVRCYVLHSATHKCSHTVGGSSAIKKALSFTPTFQRASIRLAKRGFPFVWFRWHTFACAQARRHSREKAPVTFTVRPSVRMYQVVFHRTDFYEIWYRIFLLKHIGDKIQLWLKPDENIKPFTRTPDENIKHFTRTPDENIKPFTRTPKYVSFIFAVFFT